MSAGSGLEFRRLPGDALDLPLGDLSFDRVFCANLYGLLHEPEKERWFGKPNG